MKYADVKMFWRLKGDLQRKCSYCFNNEKL